MIKTGGRPPAVPTTEGEEEEVVVVEEVSTGASTKVVDPADPLVTRTLLWMVQDASLSSEGHTGGGDTEDTMPRMRGMKALHSMVTVVEGVEAEVGAEVVDVVVEDTTEEGMRASTAEKTTAVNLLNRHRNRTKRKPSNRIRL